MRSFCGSSCAAWSRSGAGLSESGSCSEGGAILNGSFRAVVPGQSRVSEGLCFRGYCALMAARALGAERFVEGLLVEASVAAAVVLRVCVVRRSLSAVT